MMLKKMIIAGLLLWTLVEAKNIVVITDISQGISKKEAIEVVTLIDPKKSPIYKNNDKFYGYVFTEKGRKKTIGTFVEKGTSKKQNRNFYKKNYTQYFNAVKKGLKKKRSIELQEKDIVFLVDTSGSMKKNNVIKNVKKSLDRLIVDKAKKVNIAIITFDGHKSFNNSNNSKVILDFIANNNAINEAVNSITFSNFGTFLGSGLELSLNVLEKRNTKSKTIYIVSDGGNANDEEKVTQQLDRAKNSNVDIKALAVGGASISTLKKYTTAGNVYDATRGDMENMMVEKSIYKDTLLQNFAAITSSTFKKNKSEDDLLIIYSTMMEVSDLYDFYMIPNLSDGPFYRELNKKLQDEHLKIDFHGMNVYVRLLGNPSAKKENELKVFWERFIKGHNGKVESINKVELTIDEMKQ